jgi:hypothetical protein
MSLRLFLHPLEARVVVGELVEVCEGDLSGHPRVIVRDIGCGVVKPVFELHVHSGPKLLDVERRQVPVDPDLLADPASFLSGEAAPTSHLGLPASLDPPIVLAPDQPVDAEMPRQAAEAGDERHADECEAE